MATGNTGNVVGTKYERHWLYLAIIAALAVALVIAMAYIINGQKKLRQQLAQIRSASSDTSTSINTRLDTQSNALNMIAKSLQKQATAETQTIKAILAGFAAQNKKMAAITTIFQQQNAGNMAAIKTMEMQQLAQSKRVQSIEITLQQQTAVIYAALGKVIPVKMPHAFDAELSHAEDISVKLAVPHPGKEATLGLAEEVSKLSAELPPWAERDYLPRFNDLRWLTASDRLLAKTDTTATMTLKTAEAWSSYLSRLSRVEPQAGANQPSQATLDATSRLLARRAMSLDAWANNRAFKDAELAATDCLSKSEARSAAFEINKLSLWVTDKSGPNPANKTAQVRSNRARGLIRELRPLAASWEASRLEKRLVKLAPQNTAASLSVRAAGISQIFSEITAVQMGLALRGIPIPEAVAECEAQCKAALSKIAKQESTVKGKIERAYQVWALRRIEASAKVYADNAKLIGGSYKAMLNSAVRELLPIEQRYLRPAVESEYTMVYNEIWSELEGRQDQLQLAKDQVGIKRVSPSDVWRKEKNVEN